MEENKKRKNVLIISMVVFILIICSIFGLIYFNNNKKHISNEESNGYECDLEDLSGEVLNYPVQNDDNVLVSSKYFEEIDDYMQITYKYNNYTIEFTNNEDLSETNYIKIKDSNDKVIYENYYLKIGVQGSICNNDSYQLGKIKHTIPTISNGKLYFVVISTRCYGKNKYPYYSYQYIDLNSEVLKEINIQNMKLMLNGDSFKSNCKFYD